MWSIPGSSGFNITELYPIIFDKYEPLYFHLPGEQMSDFYASSHFLHASKNNKDLSLLFSSVQRAVSLKYIDLQSYLLKPNVRSRFVGITGERLAKEILEDVFEEYNNAFGMRRILVDFYSNYLSREHRLLLSKKVVFPAHYLNKTSVLEVALKNKLSFLLNMRHKYVHDATYLPFASDANNPVHIEEHAGNVNTTWLIFLTFDEFHTMTKDSLEAYWLQKYDEYIENGGMDTIERMVVEVKRQCDELNRRS